MNVDDYVWWSFNGPQTRNIVYMSHSDVLGRTVIKAVIKSK